MSTNQPIKACLYCIITLYLTKKQCPKPSYIGVLIEPNVLLKHKITSSFDVFEKLGYFIINVDSDNFEICDGVFA